MTMSRVPGPVGMDDTQPLNPARIRSGQGESLLQDHRVLRAIQFSGEPATPGECPDGNEAERFLSERGGGLSSVEA